MVQHTTQVQVGTDGQVTVASPRTGIRYTFANPNRPIVLQTAKIAAANAANADRIVAENPALSAASQQKAKQALLDEATQSQLAVTNLQQVLKTSLLTGFFVHKNWH